MNGRIAAAWLAVSLALLGGCADKHVALRYAAPTGLPRIADARPITVFVFDDRRGSEGDNDPNRVGGVYTRYGNRVSRVMTDAPFARTLADALVDAFKARGVPAQLDEHVYRPGAAPVSTPFALAGEIHNFSTETRFTTSGHVSGIVRLYGRDGRLLREKDISGRETEGLRLLGLFTRQQRLEDALGKAMAEFVLRVVNDPDISAAVSGRG